MELILMLASCPQGAMCSAQFEAKMNEIYLPQMRMKHAMPPLNTKGDW
jgi:hypothetical protein